MTNAACAGHERRQRYALVIDILFFDMGGF